MRFYYFWKLYCILSVVHTSDHETTDPMPNAFVLRATQRLSTSVLSDGSFLQSREQGRPFLNRSTESSRPSSLYQLHFHTPRPSDSNSHCTFCIVVTKSAYTKTDVDVDVHCKSDQRRRWRRSPVMVASRMKADIYEYGHKSQITNVILLRLLV
jgi:hypothetical protein